MLRRGRLRAVLAALLVALAGCASIPSDGPVRIDRGLLDTERSGVRAVAPEPARGESPAGIVNDFLIAATSDDLTDARSYLTESAAATWRPTERTVVYAGALALDGLPAGRTVPGDGDGDGGADVEADVLRVQARMSVVAEIDASGHYRAAQPGETETASLTLRREDQGQWRVDELANQLLLGESSFERLMHEVPLYFPDPTGRYLVPDVRWFPQRSSLPTTVAMALLAGPSDWLRPAVSTVAPDGTSLALDSVTVSAGVAGLELTEEVLASTPDERSLLQAQLDATLAALPGITNVQLSVRGAELAQTAPVNVLSRDPIVGSRLSVLADDHVAEVLSGRVAPVAGVPGAAGLEATGLAAAPEPGLYAVVTGGGTTLRLLRSGADDTGDPLLVGDGLTGPSFDRYGFVWTALRTGASTAVVAARTSEGDADPLIDVAADWLADRSVVALRLAPDGTRVAVASRDPGGTPRVEVAAVARDREGAPSELVVAPGGSLVPGLDGVDGVSWVDESTLAVLTDAPGGGSGVMVVTVVGPVDPLDAPAATATSIAAGHGRQSLVLGTADGRIIARAGAGWAEVLPSGSARSPVFPG